MVVLSKALENCLNFYSNLGLRVYFPFNSFKANDLARLSAFFTWSVIYLITIQNISQVIAIIPTEIYENVVENYFKSNDCCNLSRDHVILSQKS